MKHIDEYRDKKLVDLLLKQIWETSKTPVRLMEVCGGHTVAIRKFGIPELLPSTIKLLSGPGCPVCVTGKSFIDKAIKLSKIPETIITTYGDLMRVPGSSSTLENERANGAEIRMVYSPLDSIEIAKEYPSKKIFFPGIGFETTSPATAVTVLQAKKEKLDNFFLLSAHKIMPPAMEMLIDDEVQIDGYICPGHVSTITGSGIYNGIVENFGLGCVITGFEPVDLLQGILMLVKQFESGNPKVEIQYKRAVKAVGNIKALKLLDEVFELKDDWWRGLGNVPKSGLKLKTEFKKFDAELNFQLNLPEPKEEKGCICGEILKGLKLPSDCKMFGKICTPENPVGACMVSTEGSCQAFYKYQL
ncbi:MAG: hydrogenase formation protein HypD [Prolixibacteraceae bacterium]|nr:hydrogenase formation protein HypD [Prolixibacteraceae bacterium]MBT6006084.1 hydrogenase formation protein HypD [Prolixibacteraceae bacterium]MBT6765621.1 hydrogenase formation protein HypD [Prolixibacteraceae bacterium]MBT6999658.1 hydrogenase formation protein HypD [Prolixibacteraceae bacterium]MBT7394995.1 hydrogenase formation protein HypD [Prolixibacteraceae bacterium]